MIGGGREGGGQGQKPKGKGKTKRGGANSKRGFPKKKKEGGRGVTLRSYIYNNCKNIKNYVNK